MKKKLTEPLKKKSELISNFLEDVKKVNEVVPFIKQAQEETDWTIGVFKDIPDDIAKVVDANKMQDIFVKDLKVWNKALPPINLDSSYLTSAGSGASGTASQVVYSQILDARAISGSSQNPALVSWSSKHLAEYEQIRSRQTKVSEIEKLLSKIRLELSLEFSEANASFSKADKSVVEPNDAANSMRNVLNHVEGNLLEISRSGQKIQVSKGQMWAFFSDKLSIGGKNSVEHSLLLQKQNDQAKLKHELTDILKKTSKDPLARLRELHVQWLDHLYTTLKLVDPKFIS